MDLRSVVVVDLRLAELQVPELVGSLATHASSNQGSARSLPSSDPDRRDEHQVLEIDSDRLSSGRSGHDPAGLEMTADPQDLDISRQPFESDRQAWPEIRFYLGSTALFFIAFALATGVWVLGPAVVLGWHSAAITSGSMEPAIRVGDVVVFSEPSAEPLARGAVIVFPDGEGSLVTHRLIGELDDGRYITRGDNNSATDSTPVRHEDVRGEGRLLVPFAGYPAVWTSSGSPVSVLAVAFGFGLLSFASRWALLPRFNPWRAYDG